MAQYSFIDSEKRDFLRRDGELIVIGAATVEGAEQWLLSEGVKYGWTNTGIKYFNWDEEFPES